MAVDDLKGLFAELLYKNCKKLWRKNLKLSGSVLYTHCMVERGNVYNSHPEDLIRFVRCAPFFCPIISCLPEEEYIKYHSWKAGLGGWEEGGTEGAKMESASADT